VVSSFSFGKPLVGVDILGIVVANSSRIEIAEKEPVLMRLSSSDGVGFSKSYLFSCRSHSQVMDASLCSQNTPL
jgi:hypothetical protein